MNRSLLVAFARICRLSLVVTVAAFVAHAAVIGNFATDGNGTTVTVSLTSFSFGPSPSLKVAQSNLTSDGGTPLPVNDTGTVANIGLVFPIPNFMTFMGTPLSFTLVGVGPGDTTDPHDCSTATTNGKSCSLLLPLPGSPVSPVILTFANGGTNATLNVFGTVTDGSGIISDWSGTIGATLTADLSAITSPTGSGAPTPVDIAAYFAGHPTGAIITSWSGTFTATPIPEPDTVLSLGVGLGLTLLSRLRRRR